ncbi:MAG: glycoside hydrolase family 140 protein [Bryobacteraceae bacterium]
MLPLILLSSGILAAQLPNLRVSDHQRFLVTVENKPFFYLGDTAWELFHRLNREDASRYLENRARNGFTVIQAVALAELDGLNDPNPYGHRPLLNNDPLHPDVKEGPANDYWDHVDFIVCKANSLGLYVGFLPTWGDKWNARGRSPEIFTPQNAEAYGEWLGRRYRDAGIIWILGGDRPVETAVHRQILSAIAAGLKKGDAGTHLITYHPNGGSGSAEPFHSEPWLQFNMRQNGHSAEFTGRYDKTAFDYGRTPVKPVIDGEPIYEDHPVSFRAPELGHSIAADVRRTLYWNLFTGAFGHTYGHHSVWQMWTPARKPINNPLMPWHEAMQQPGAIQMQHARRLLQSRPFLTRIPDDSVIAASAVPTAVPGAGRYRFSATRDTNGSYALIYVPAGRRFSVHLNKISGSKVTAWWFDPRTGEATSIGTFPNSGQREFEPPAPGESTDWVLVLDDADRKYPPPGSR